MDVAGGKTASGYANNLNSFNHFRNQAGGSAITPKQYNAYQDSSLFGCTQAGGEASYKANITKRHYGHLFAGVEVSKFAAVEEAYCAGYVFVPGDLEDLSDFQIGDRYKITFKTADNTSKTVGPGRHTTSSKVYEEKTEHNGAQKGQDATNSVQYLYVTEIGDAQVPYSNGTV